MSFHSDKTDDFLALEIKRLPKVNGKPAFEILVKEVINFNSDFGHKLPCSGKTFSLGSACSAKCAYCYLETWSKSTRRSESSKRN